ncbi:MAG TPA: radical SAM protein [Steroidobacteraceae bacterium]|nr:radical SAM protein [Steroidobacteraceae bacterium]
MTPVTATSLRELWVHTGTACNLECPFCLEDSKPGDTRLQRVMLADLKPHLDDAARLGVERFVFTGGEPLIVKDIAKILHYALELKPCLILTNGTAPLIKRAHQLQLLKQRPQALSFRVSIDHPDERLHDAERGWGNFKRAIEGIKILLHTGFEVSIARHASDGENTNEIIARYRELFKKNGLPENLRLTPWPELGRPGKVPTASPPSDDEIAHCRHALMCRDTRMVLKRDGQVRVYACALTDDDVRFDLGPSLPQSLPRAVQLIHARCGQCVRRGVSLGN